MEEQAELKKCSSDRLKLKLCDAGIDEQVVLAMDRAQLLNAAAEHKMKAKVLLSDSMAERELYLREQDLKLRQAEAVAREAAAQLQMQMREDDIRREAAAREADIRRKKQGGMQKCSFVIQKHKGSMNIANTIENGET